MSRVVTNLQEAAALVFDQSKQTFAPKPTFAALSEAITEAVDSFGDGVTSYTQAGKLKDQLFLSPRLPQWHVAENGYRIFNASQTGYVQVTEDLTVVSNRKKHDVLLKDLPAATLFKAIQDAQALIQPRTASMATNDDEGDEFFGDDPEFAKGAGLDAALEETHAEPLIEDDAELIEEVVAADEEDRSNFGGRGVGVGYSIDEDGDDDDHGIEAEIASIEKQADALKEEIEAKTASFTANANRKNAVTDGVICDYCGNLNRSAYKGTCPKCPKQPINENQSGVLVASESAKPKSGKGKVSEEWVLSRLKSLQGRVLTILDASPIADKTQRDAVKSLLNKEFRREMDKVSGENWRDDDPRFPRE